MGSDRFFACLFDGHTLGQIPRLVHICAPRASRVVRQQLQRHHVQQGTECAVVFGHADDVDAFAVFNFRVGIGQHIEHAASGAHFLQVAFELFKQAVVGRHGDHRHGAGDQGQRAVFEFAGGVGLGVYVADFLELERAFHGDRVMQAAP